MRRLMAILLMAGVAGCGSGFQDEAEELRYLSSLSNPSVTQFQRKEELVKKMEMAKYELLEKESEKRIAEVAKEEADRVEREKHLPPDERHAKVQAALAAAKEKEDQGMKESYGLASRYYKEIVDKFPQEPEAAFAAQKMKECEAKAYGPYKL